DGDGNLDLAASLRNANEVAFVAGNGNGTFLDPVAFPVAGKEPVSIVAADMDQDGRPDLITADFANGLLGGFSILRGRGDGTFDPPSLVRAGRGPGLLQPVDLDHDGAMDLGCTLIEPRGLILLENVIKPASAQDCNGNGIPDRCDIESGLST